MSTEKKKKKKNVGDEFEVLLAKGCKKDKLAAYAQMLTHTHTYTHTHANCW